MGTDLSEIAAKVRKLLALAEGKGATEGEVANSMMLAKRLLAKHHLSMSDLPQEDADDPADQFTFARAEAIGNRQHFAQFEKSLIAATEALTGTEALRFAYSHRLPSGKRVKRNNLVFLGDEADVALAVVVCKSLFKTARRAARERVGTGWKPDHRNFAEGFSDRVLVRARAIAEDRAAQTDTAEECTALVVLDETKKDWLAEQMATIDFTVGKPKKRTGAGNEDLYFEGTLRGDHEDLGFDDRIEG